MAGSNRWRTLGLLAVVMALLTSACGGSSETSTAVTDDTASASAQTTGQAPPSDTLAFLGDLVTETSEPVVAAIDAAGGSLSLDDGTNVVIPAGALDTTVEFTTYRAALDLAPSLGEAGDAAIYVVSTAGPVVPASPVLIDVARPADETRAVRILGGDIEHVPVSGSDRASVEIHHFSDAGFLLFSALARDRARVAPLGEHRSVEEQSERNADAVFLDVCIRIVSTAFARETGSFEVDDVAIDIALSTCTTALIRRVSPSGNEVSIDCVGDQIDAGVDLRDAVAACDDDAATDAAPDPAEEADDDAPAPLETTDTPPAQTVWVGEFGYSESQYSIIDQGQIEIERIPGTDEFTVTMDIVYGDSGPVCDIAYVYTYEGTGRLYADQLYFNGTQIWTPTGDCDVPDAQTNERPFAVFFTETGFRGQWIFFDEFEIEGEIPQPTGE